MRNIMEVQLSRVYVRTVLPRKSGRAYIGTVPSQKRVRRICEMISAMTGRDHTLLEQRVVVAKLNRLMLGGPTTSV